ncbi:unnamed protein product, partial [Scytosiphon promiscuus]
RVLSVYVSGKEDSPVFRTVQPADGAGARQKMTVGPGAAKIRPYVVCAVLRGVSFNAKSYKSFMDLQVRWLSLLFIEKCRRRRQPI